MAEKKTDLARRELMKLPVGTRFNPARIADKDTSSSSLYHFLKGMIKEGSVERVEHGTFVKLKDPLPKKLRTRKTVIKSKRGESQKSIAMRVVKTAVTNLEIGTIFTKADIVNDDINKDYFTMAAKKAREAGLIEKLSYRRYKRVVNGTMTDYKKTPAKKSKVKKFVIYQGVIYPTFEEASKALKVSVPYLRMVTTGTGIFKGKFIDAAITREDAEYFAREFKKSEKVRSNDVSVEKPRLLDDYCD